MIRARRTKSKESRPRKEHGADAERLRETMRALVKKLEADGTINDPTDWSRKAHLPEATLRMFLSGETGSMTMVKYVALARAVGLPVATLVGEDATRDEKERLILEAYRATVVTRQAEELLAAAERERRQNG